MRHDCSFDTLIDQTPQHLLDVGLYDEIAMNLAGDEWREAGLALIAHQLAKGSGTREQAYPKEPGSEASRQVGNTEAQLSHAVTVLRAVRALGQWKRRVTKVLPKDVTGGRHDRVHA